MEYHAAKLRGPAHAWWKQETGMPARAADAVAAMHGLRWRQG
jgi:hypothetical protein